MPRPAFSEASPSAVRRGRQRLAVLAAGAVMVVGALTAIAASATATPAASAAGSHLTAQDCGGGMSTGGGRACVEPAATLARATGASAQACGGGWIGSGNRTCVESVATTSSATTQDCGGGWIGSGNRTCVASTPALANDASMHDCRGPFSGSGGVVACTEPGVTLVRMPDPPMPCGPLSTYCPAPTPEAALVLATTAFVQDCTGGTSTSGGRACVESRAHLAGATLAA